MSGPMLAVDGFHVAELVIAGILVLLGIRSLVKWMRVPFRPESAGESVLYALHVTARVGMWFAFAGFFVGYALVDDPKGFRWYVLVPLGLAAIQLLTSLALGLGTPAGRTPPAPPPPSGAPPTAPPPKDRAPD